MHFPLLVRPEVLEKEEEEEGAGGNLIIYFLLKLCRLQTDSRFFGQVQRFF